MTDCDRLSDNERQSGKDREDMLILLPTSVGCVLGVLGILMNSCDDKLFNRSD